MFRQEKRVALSVELRFRVSRLMSNALGRVFGLARGLMPRSFRVDAFNARWETQVTGYSATHTKGGP